MRRSMTLLLLLLLLLLLPVLELTSWSVPASAYTLELTSWQDGAVVAKCTNSGALRKRLIAKYGEVVLYEAIDNGGQSIEIYVNPKTSTWSIVVVYTYGISCLIGSGTNWKGPMDAKEERRASAR